MQSIINNVGWFGSVSLLVLHDGFFSGTDLLLRHRGYHRFRLYRRYPGIGHGGGRRTHRILLSTRCLTAVLPTLPEFLYEDDPAAIGPFGTEGIICALSWYFVFGLGLAGQPHIITKMMMTRNIADNRFILPASIPWLCDGRPVVDPARFCHARAGHTGHSRAAGFTRYGRRGIPAVLHSPHSGRHRVCRAVCGNHVYCRRFP